MCHIIRSVDLRFKHNLPLLYLFPFIGEIFANIISHIIVNNKNVSNVAGGDGRNFTVQEEGVVGFICYS